ncbi:hypothetical protein M595_1253 [Lyngbya aestuarii BL J]|uniref:Uncharacterized protein n=1 Tax=Lyngbya aestuarii BL J TaxID=1348334 RepID=U7QNN7_9CYAN|nr:hypothetical protein M595_1253 [Lyngbya aestuarii BL J]
MRGTRAITIEPINKFCSRCGDWLIIGFSDEQLANAIASQIIG